MKSSRSAVEFKGLNKRCGNVQACRDLTFSVTEGSIHGIIGENGAGKSTAMKMLFGLQEPDSGTIELFGQPRPAWTSPIQAKSAGVGMVHQHFMLADDLSALDNLILAEAGAAYSRLDRKAALAKYENLAREYHFEVPFLKKVEELTVGEQQRIEILKVLAQDSKLIILDEPTAVLTPNETAKFFEQVRRLKAEGRTIIIISHKLKEIMDLTDEVTVFRKGSVVAHARTSETTPEQLAEWMIGRRQVSYDLPPVKRGHPLLKITDLDYDPPAGTAFKKLNLEIAAGEIVGLAGVEGNGQETLLRLFTHGQQEISKISGRAEFLGRELTRHGVKTWRKEGTAFLPEDRLRAGVLDHRPVLENVLLGQQHRFGGWLSWKRVAHETQSIFESYDVSPRNPDMPIGRYSGGNQQKIVVGRELGGDPRFVIAYHPTRGVDIGASEIIHQKLIAQSRERGAAVLVVSSEIEELMKICDRIAVFYRGQLIKELPRADFNEKIFGEAMGGLV